MNPKPINASSALKCMDTFGNIFIVVSFSFNSNDFKFYSQGILKSIRDTTQNIKGVL